MESLGLSTTLYWRPKLYNYGIKEVPFLWLESYLERRTQFVEISGHRSRKIQIKCGVPQGSILGPLLFLIYINNINNSLTYGNLTQYADDIAMCLSSKSKTNLEIRSNIDLNCCVQRFLEHNLKTNIEKSSYINFHSSFKLLKIPID